jgi:hypothetical protein
MVNACLGAGKMGEAENPEKSRHHMKVFVAFLIYKSILYYG